MTVTITDTGPTRIVEITGAQCGFYSIPRLSGDGVVGYGRTETHYQRATLEALLALKGEAWLRDEIARAEEPAYIQEPLRRQFARFVPVTGQRVLDFGCGCGGSSICLARLGAAAVVGVEPAAAAAQVARLRAADCGLADRVTCVYVADTTRLPFVDGQFDMVILNAVVEHIPPRTRHAHLREVWRVIAPGGYLFINETPNRLWPQEYHTTGLWGVSYIPLALAWRYALVRGRLPHGTTVAAALGMGVRGGVYWEIAAAVAPTGRLLNWTHGDDVALFWARTLARPGQSPRRIALKRGLSMLHRLVDRVLLRPLGLPAVAFLPELALCFQKAVVKS